MASTARGGGVVLVPLHMGYRSCELPTRLEVVCPGSGGAEWIVGSGSVWRRSRWLAFEGIGTLRRRGSGLSGRMVWSGLLTTGPRRRIEFVVGIAGVVRCDLGSCMLQAVDGALWLEWYFSG